MINFSNKIEDWFLLERVKGFDLLQNFPIADAIADNKQFKREFGFCLKNILVIMSEYSDLCFSRSDWNRAAYLAFSAIEKNPGLAEKVNGNIYKTAQELEKFTEKIFTKKKDMSFLKAINSFENFLGLLNNHYTYALFYELMELGPDKYLTSLLLKILNNRLYSKKENASGMNFIVLTSATKSSWVEKERVDFLKMLIKIKSGGGKVGLISKHTRKYFWIPSAGSFSTWGKNYFIKQVEKFRKDPWQELKAIKKKRANLRKNIIRIEENLFLDEKERNIFKAVRELSFLKDFRRGVQNKAFLGVYFKIIPALAKELGCSVDDLRWVIIEEIKQRKIDKDEIKKRKKNCIYLVKGGRKGIVLSGPQNVSFFLSLIKEEVRSKQKIKGTVTYRDNRKFIKGKAKIISGRNDLKKFRKNEILVSHMTNPDITEAMIKARAIITDIGGLTCHAAIVSREFSIPCVVGTKIATQVLKDGDEVEVDTDKGVVKILKK